MVESAAVYDALGKPGAAAFRSLPQTLPNTPVSCRTLQQFVAVVHSTGVKYWLVTCKQQHSAAKCCELHVRPGSNGAPANCCVCSTSSHNSSRVIDSKLRVYAGSRDSQRLVSASAMNTAVFCMVTGHAAAAA
jgi:hypothetical protein